MNYGLGIDFGTSGARAIGIDQSGVIQAQVAVPFDQPNCPKRWQSSLFSLLEKMPRLLRQRLRTIAINGTSSTVLICDASGQPLRDALMYNDDRGQSQLADLQTIAPPHHIVLSPTSSLAKLLWLSQQPEFAQAQYFLHQADWIAAQLHGQLGLSDYHNALKLGYDVGALTYPDWLMRWFSQRDLVRLLPKVLTPGQPIGPVLPDVARTYDLPADCVVCAGTTDSIAAFLASRVTTPGEAVTSLGSTLVVKLLSDVRVEDRHFGIYSHRLGDRWLVGGASNTGGAVLKQFFSSADLTELSKQIDPNRRTELDYYPLIQPGDRFPVNDPTLLPRLTPRPDNPVIFLQGLLEGMARIEAQGYALLQQLGATPLIRVKTAGGGAKNPVWMTLRQQQLGVPVTIADQLEAAYGSALLGLSASLN